MKKHHLKTPYTQQEKQIRVLLPSNYNETENAYPVLYMHDGQNLFYKKESYANSTWGVRKALKHEDIILVSLDNSNDRIQEYIPFRRPFQENLENYGDLYLQWLVYEVKPFIDSQYRTLSNREHTFIAGSSLGGLISAYAASKYRAVFSKAGIFSLAILNYWPELQDIMEKYPLSNDSQIFVQVGTHEIYDYKKKQVDLKSSQSYLDSNLNYTKELIRLGLPVENLHLNVDINAKHEEKAWRKSFPKFIKFLKD